MNTTVIAIRYGSFVVKTMIDCTDQQLSASFLVEKAMHAFGDMTHE